MKTGRLNAIATNIFLLAFIFSPLATQAYAVSSLTFTVNATSDVVDYLPGDGICETAPGNGMCTLRAAIMEANAHIGADSIYLPDALYNLTIPGAGEDFSASGDLDITESLNILGESNYAVINAADLEDRVLEIYSLEPVFISLVTISNGESNNEGGAISAHSNLNLDSVDLIGNHAVGNGGAIYSLYTLNISNSIIASNSSEGIGGGIYTNYNLTLSNSRIGQNDSEGDGGGL